MDNIEAGGKQFVHCREVVRSSECPLSEVPLYSKCLYLYSQTKFGEIKRNLLFQATIKCLETPEERFERDSRVYNIQAVSFTPAELVEEMKKHLSNFVSPR